MAVEEMKTVEEESSSTEHEPSLESGASEKEAPEVEVSEVEVPPLDETLA